jgi:HSP20 family protein
LFPTTEGGREDESKKRGRKYQREERISGSFHRTIPLPMSVESSRGDVKLADGVLYITLPKREETKQKKISVKISWGKEG